MLSMTLATLILMIKGYVYYPNISIEEEMTDMISAKAAYQANITTIQTFKEMFRSGLEI